jgi:hypothetical protein
MNSLVNRATRLTFGIARGGLLLGERLGRRVASDAVGLMLRIRRARGEPKGGPEDPMPASTVEAERFLAADAPTRADGPPRPAWIANRTAPRAHSGAVLGATHAATNATRPLPIRATARGIPRPTTR